MKKTQYGEIVMTKDEYRLLKEALAEYGINLMWSVADADTYTAYIRNPYREALYLYGSDLAKEQAKEYYERYERF